MNFQSAAPSALGVMRRCVEGFTPPSSPTRHGPSVTAAPQQIFSNLGKVGLKVVSEVASPVKVGLKGVSEVTTS